MTGAAVTGPSGADRPAKYPRQKPRSPAASKAARASAAKYVTACTGSVSVHIRRAVWPASSSLTLAPVPLVPIRP